MKYYTVVLKTKPRINHDLIYSTPIIGYDHEFWTCCNEHDRPSISALRRDDKQKRVKMHCHKHKEIEFSITPYSYFVTGKKCPYCKCNDDIGAVNVDESIAAFWNDSRFLLDDISEHSTEQFLFHCPFCGYDFSESMESMINKSPKCPMCFDGVSQNNSFEGEADMPYLFISRLRH